MLFIFFIASALCSAQTRRETLKKIGGTVKYYNYLVSKRINAITNAITGFIKYIYNLIAQSLYRLKLRIFGVKLNDENVIITDEEQKDEELNENQNNEGVSDENTEKNEASGEDATNSENSSPENEINSENSESEEREQPEQGDDNQNGSDL